MTKVINLFAGPGAGKSSLAHELVAGLKRDRNVEFASEFAKDLTWAKRHKCLASQAYIFGKQLYRIERLIGQVDYIVTDSPILLSLVYAKNYPSSFRPFVLDMFHRFENWNYFVKRTKPYNPIGRNQTEDEAKAKDEEVLQMLAANNILYANVMGDPLILREAIIKELKANEKV